MVTTQLLHFQFQFHFRIDSPPTQTNPNFLTRRNNNGVSRCTRSGDSQSRSRWYSDDSKRFDFTLDYDEDDGDFGYKNATKKRNWWSGDGDDEEEDDEGEEFGVLEGSISGIALITKVMKAFGWMVPAILISMIVGTGPNAFFMALALPLAQTALSLVLDTFSGKNPNNNPTRYKPRTKKKPFASNVGRSKQKDSSSGNDAKGERSSSKFGGWDELDQDQQRRTTQAKEQSQPKKGKLSRMVRKQDKPLALRLLIAIFPFLGSWTRFL